MVKMKIGLGNYGVVIKDKDRIIKINKKLDLVIACLRELEILHTLNHECIIKLTDVLSKYDVINLQDFKKYCIKNIDDIHFVFELADGDLVKFMKTTYTLDDLLSICLDILLGLNYIHKSGYGHFDIKIDNIVYKKCENNIRAKIIDFGMTYPLLKSKLNIKEIGTLTQISPEAIIGDAYDEKTDIWTFGHILYALLFNQEIIKPAKLKISEIVDIYCSKIDDCDTHIFKKYRIKKIDAKNIDQMKPPDWLNIDKDIEIELKNLLKVCLKFDSNKRIKLDDIISNKLFSNFGERIKNLYHNDMIINTKNNIMFYDHKLLKIKKYVQKIYNFSYEWITLPFIITSINLFKKILEKDIQVNKISSCFIACLSFSFIYWDFSNYLPLNDIKKMIGKFNSESFYKYSTILKNICIENKKVYDRGLIEILEKSIYYDKVLSEKKLLIEFIDIHLNKKYSDMDLGERFEQFVKDHLFNK